MFNRNPPNNMENKITKLANKFAADKFLNAVAKQRHKPAAAKLNNTKTSKNLPKMGNAELSPII